MAKTIKRNTVRPLYLKGNTFDFGGQSKTAWQNSMKTKNLGGTVSAVVSGITGIASAAMDSAKIKDTTGLEANINDTGNTDFSASDNTSLLDQWNNMNWANTNLRTSDLTQSTGTQVGNTLKGIGSGAAAGAQIGGPFGAVIGGAAGLASGIVGSIFGSQKARREKNRLNALAQEANARAENGFLNSVDAVNEDNYYNFMRNIAADGGQLENNHGGLFTPHGLRMINAGQTHEENPLGGVLQGFDQEGTPNLVEEGEVIFNGYVFSNRLSPSKRMLEAAGLPSKYKGKTYARIAEELSKASRENPTDHIAKRTMEIMLHRLQILQETQKARAEENKIRREFAKGGNLFDGISGPSKIVKSQIPEIDLFAPTSGAIGSAYNQGLVGYTQPEFNVPDFTVKAGDVDVDGKLLATPTTKASNNIPTYDTRARYAPIIGTGLAALQSALERPDYQHIQPVQEYVGRIRPQRVSARPVGRYMQYNPMDVNYMLNNVRSQSAATRRALANSANAGAAQAALLAEGMNTGNNIGQALLQGRQYNDNLRNQVIQFNAGIDQYNSQNATQVDMQNAANALNAQFQKANMLYNIANQKKAIDDQLDAVRGANATVFFDNLGAMGNENFAFNQINHDKSNMGYWLDWLGRTNYRTPNRSSCGGKLKIKK